MSQHDDEAVSSQKRNCKQPIHTGKEAACQTNANSSPELWMWFFSHYIGINYIVGNVKYWGCSKKNSPPVTCRGSLYGGLGMWRLRKKQPVSLNLS